MIRSCSSRISERRCSSPIGTLSSIRLPSALVLARRRAIVPLPRANRGTDRTLKTACDDPGPGVWVARIRRLACRRSDMSSAVDGPAGEAYVSTGELPGRDLVDRLVREGYDRYRANRDGEVSQAYPALASVPADLFGVCVAGTSGAMFAAGDADHEFTIMSVSKPFVFALVSGLIAPDDARERLGV